MRPLALAFLAGLALPRPAAALGIVVEPPSLAPGRTVVVSWEVPPGCEESELLLEVEGGPRVRLTGEQRGEAPRVVVRVPSLAGAARLVVRAGVEEPDGTRRERDVLWSEPFALAADPHAPAAPPVRAAPTRPVGDAAWEWWEAGAAGGDDAPEGGLGRAATPEPEAETAFPRGLPAARAAASAPPASGGRETAVDRPAFPRAGAGARLRRSPFPGAPVPLRN